MTYLKFLNKNKEPSSHTCGERTAVTKTGLVLNRMMSNKSRPLNENFNKQKEEQKKTKVNEYFIDIRYQQQQQQQLYKKNT